MNEMGILGCEARIESVPKVAFCSGDSDFMPTAEQRAMQPRRRRFGYAAAAARHRAI